MIPLTPDSAEYEAVPYIRAAGAGRSMTAGADATRLGRQRRQLGVTQNDLADAANISVRTLQRVEAGHYNNPPIRHLASIAFALGLTDWSDLVEEEWVKPFPGATQLHLSPDAGIKRRRRPAGQRIDPTPDRQSRRPRAALPETSAARASVLCPPEPPTSL